MRPEAIYRCVQDYNGLTKKAEALNLREGKLYFKNSGPEYVYLNDYDQPSIQLPWLRLEEFAELEGTYLTVHQNLRAGGS